MSENSWRVDVVRLADNQIEHSVATTSEEKALKLEQAMLSRIDRDKYFVLASDGAAAV